MIEQKYYDEIKRSFPINAVELIVLNQRNEVLMLKRENEPAKSQWWIPGGRVLFAESRSDAAKRLLKGECGADATESKELGMFEYLVENRTENCFHHILSTVYLVRIPASTIRIDSQSSDYRWAAVAYWIENVQHDFLKQLLNGINNNSPARFEQNNWNAPAGNGFIRNELYEVILSAMPIPCVDLLVRNDKDEILLVKRKNEPAKDLWWVPGGRVLFGEKRKDAAQRKLMEECGLDGDAYAMIGNFDFVYYLPGNKVIHNISTLYGVSVKEENVILDEQSLGFSWRRPEEWLKQPLDEFIKNTIENTFMYDKASR